MLKAAGSILVFGAAVLLGEWKATELREQYAQLEYVRQLFYILQSEIRYARSPLNEIFSYIGNSVREPYKTWLLELGRKLEGRNGGTFADLWKTSIGEHLAASALPENELLRLEELGERLGLADLELQIRAVELYLTQLDASILEIRKDMKIKIRLYHCLGIMGGLLIVILLL